jgi:hypothetical protein
LFSGEAINVVISKKEFFSILLGENPEFCGVKEAGVIMYREEVDFVLANPRNDAVIADYNLSDVTDTQFRDDSARPWIARQLVSSAKNSVGEGRRHLWRIPSNEQTDRVEVIRRLRRPPYLSHFAIRCRTSS